MRFFAASILILLLIPMTFSKWMLIWQYERNKTYVASVLCENKNKPLLHCNGNCVLMKKMRAAEQQESPTSNKQLPVVKLVETYCSFQSDYSLSTTPAETTHIFNGYYIHKRYSAPAPTIFHPPTC